MKTRDDLTNTKKSIEEHLLTRELVDFDVLTLMTMDGKEPQGTAEITLNEEVLAKVANAWENEKEAITTVVAARIKPLIMQAALHDIPQEVTVTRQAIMELVGLLRDFEVLHKESVTRSQKEKK